ncbi:hypothetical protein GCM10017691_25560 [Pseudonocardia petroleophila]
MTETDTSGNHGEASPSPNQSGSASSQESANATAVNTPMDRRSRPLTPVPPRVVEVVDPAGVRVVTTPARRGGAGRRGSGPVRLRRVVGCSSVLLARRVGGGGVGPEVGLRREGQ